VRNLVLIAVPTAMMIVAVSSFAQDRPRTTQPTQPAPQASGWFAQLADDDPGVRDAARVSLMGLQRDDLAMLKKVVEQNRPIAPAQAAVLRDIVVHVFLSGEPYEKNAGIGFLGVSLDDVHQPIAGPVNDDADAPGRTADAVLVTNTHPGFSGHRYLRTDDIVVGVLGVDLLMTVRHQDLRDLVKRTLPGETITLQVVRQGKPRRIPVKPDAQPVVAEQPRDIIEQFVNERMGKADEYWQKNFAPLIAAPLSYTVPGTPGAPAASRG
jgi:hypothetical protein